MASKKKGASTLMNDGDRISSLPDEVLCHILSFLPTKYSVRTSVLSTRWKHLFSFVRNLDFNCDSSPKIFIDSISSVFASYKVSHMNKFSLVFITNRLPDNFPICSWISCAILHNVQEIDINLHYFSGVRLTMTLDLFSGTKTLTTLILEGFMNFVLFASICLPCLKTLVLGRVCFDDQSAKRLFRSCPVLEDLDLSTFTMAEGVKLLDITSLTLKRLTIYYPLNQVYRYVFNVPNLVSFKYSGPPIQEFLGLKNLEKVVDAWIYVSRTMEPFDRDGVSVELVRAFSHVQKLTLCSETIEVFIRSDHSLPKFNNLTSLGFYPITSRSWKLLPSLLDNSPRLELLTLDHGGFLEDLGDDEEKYKLPECVPACVALHLREIEFRCSHVSDYDLKIVNYFLKYATNLKRLKITSKSSPNEQLNEKFENTSAEIVFQVGD